MGFDRSAEKLLVGTIRQRTIQMERPSQVLIPLDIPEQDLDVEPLPIHARVGRLQLRTLQRGTPLPR